jgi:hypothetical protein
LQDFAAKEMAATRASAAPGKLEIALVGGNRTDWVRTHAAAKHGERDHEIVHGHSTVPP